MKKLLTLIAFAPLSLLAQKITVEKDPFNKQNRVETGWVTLKQNMFDPLAVRYRSVGLTTFFQISGNGSYVVGAEDELQLLLENEAVVKLKSTGVQSYEINKYANSWNHQYFVTADDLLALSESKVKAIRKYTSDGYIDYQVAQKNADKFKEFTGKFVDTLIKAEKAM